MSPVPSAADLKTPTLPRWASALDLVCVALTGLTILVLAFGGLRVRQFGMRVSIMSPWRPLILAAAIAVVRHAIVRTDPIYSRVMGWIVATRRSEAFAACWPVFVTTRVAVLAIGYFAVMTIGYPERVPPFRVYENEFRNLPARWDTGWYLAIASGGYEWDRRAPGQQRIAFFPAYPILMRIVGRLLREEMLWAGLLVSLAAFFGALVYCYRLARDQLDADRAATATLLLAAYPFALFYSAAYTESLFLLAAAGAIYHLKRGRLVACGGWGVLAGLVRPNGCLLAIPLGLLVLEARRREARPLFELDRRTVVRLVAAAMPLVGLAIFSVFLYQLTGNPFEWARNHAQWGRTYRGVHRIVLDRYDFISEYGLYEYTVSLPVDILNGFAGLFALVMVWPVWRRLGWSAAAFILVNLLPPMAMGGLLSIGRVTTVLFPIFICLAATIRPERRMVWLTGFAMLQAFFAALFFTWRPLF